MQSYLTHYRQPKANTNSWQEIVDQLIHLRKSKSYSQEVLAHRIGCTSSLIHKWEQHKRVPSGFMFSCWLDALGAQIKISEKI